MFDKILNKHLSKDIQTASKHMKRFATLPVIKEIQVKTTMRYNFTRTRIYVLSKSKTVGKNIEKLNPCALVVEI